MNDFPGILFLKQNRVWCPYLGGKNLDKLAGSKNPQDTNYSEDWIASTVRCGNRGTQGIIDEGLARVELRQTEYCLKDVFEAYPEGIFGKDYYSQRGLNSRFLVKLVDYLHRPQVECHPTVDFARKYLNINSAKAEAYLILQAREEISSPYFYLGFQRAPDKREFRQAVVSQNVPRIISYFDRIFVKPGDVIVVPGGFPHAIGEGILALELSEIADCTVKVEFKSGNSVITEQSRFMGRGIDFALSMFNFEKLPVPEVKSRYFIQPVLSAQHNEQSAEYILTAGKSFTLKKLTVRGVVNKQEPVCYTGIVILGHGEIKTGSMQANVSAGSRFLVPAGRDIEFISPEGLEIVIISVM